jgi:hypothetical protein
MSSTKAANESLIITSKVTGIQPTDYIQQQIVLYSTSLEGSDLRASAWKETRMDRVSAKNVYLLQSQIHFHL